MTRGNKILIGVVITIMVAIGGGYMAIHAASGLESPLSVIMSSSMQHDNYQSQIGVIDTGDVMIVQDPSKAEIQSYVEGSISGYKTFGDYGSVIIYERGDDVNPCIHRAIIWLDYNQNGTWKATSLKDYEGSWSCTGSMDIYSLSGTLTFTDITQSKKTVSINLDSLGKQSGYLTMGDNPESNRYFDQSAGIIDHPIGTDDIRSVAIMEIPWLGVIKVYMSESKMTYLSHVPNSINSLVMLFVMIFAIIYVSDSFYARKEMRAKKKKLQEMDGIHTSCEYRY